MSLLLVTESIKTQLFGGGNYYEMNWYGCSVVERLLSTTVRMNDTVIRISRRVRKSPSSSACSRPTPREARTESDDAAAKLRLINERRSTSLPRRLPPPTLPPGRAGTFHNEPRLMPPLSSSFDEIPTTPTDDQHSYEQRKKESDVPPALEHWWPTSAADSQERDAGRPSSAVRHPPPTIVVRSRSPPRQDQAEMKVFVPATTGIKQNTTKPISVRKDASASNGSAASVATTTSQEMLPLSEVPDEKLKLLKKLVDGDGGTFGGARVTVEVREKCLRFSGSAEQIETATTEALEALLRISCTSAGVSRKQLELLTSDRGRKWFEDLLARNGGPIVVLFAKDVDGYIAAADDAAASRVKSVLRESLATETISVGPELSEFLRSKQWSDAVGKYESTWFLRVTRDDSSSRVVLDGCARAVADVGSDIRQLLKQNSRVNRSIQLQTGEYRLLKQHLEADVYQRVKNHQG